VNRHALGGSIVFRRSAAIVAGICLLRAGPPALRAQETHPPIGREAALNLEFPELDFDPPEVRREAIGPDVPVLFLEDHTLPLVTVIARFKGGFGLFPRERYAAATALPGLLRSGGTETMPPDSVDGLLEGLAVSATFGSGGESVFSAVNTLTSTLDEAMQLWTEMLRRPGFDSTEIEVWRGRELESVIRRKDDPRRLAFSEFNRLMYGDHPTGWEMEPSDLEPEDLRLDLLRTLHREIFCPENLILGVTGDITWEEASSRLEALIDRWPPCPGPLPEPPKARIRHEPGVYLIPRDLAQSTVVMAHATEVRQGDTREFFASRIGNAILGNSGFSSRLVSRVRTEEGYAYSASSLWTTPQRSAGIVGAITQTRSETTVAALRLILRTIEEMAEAPPAQEEVDQAVAQAVNGFVFNFQRPSQIVSRQMLYMAREMPENWLERYLQGIQGVTPAQVRKVFDDHVRPEDMTILILGDPDAFDGGLDEIGDVRIWEVAGLDGG
jgi:predicted Zn-dependent peptidase